MYLVIPKHTSANKNEPMQHEHLQHCHVLYKVPTVDSGQFGISLSLAIKPKYASGTLKIISCYIYIIYYHRSDAVSVGIVYPRVSFI